MAHDFNLDQLHRELEDTEKYIKVQSDNVLRRSTTSVRGSGDFGATRVSASAAFRASADGVNEGFSAAIGSAASAPVPAATPSQSLQDSRYAETKKRDDLIQRLLTDYNQRKNKAPRSYLDLPEVPSEPPHPSMSPSSSSIKFSPSAEDSLSPHDRYQFSEEVEEEGVGGSPADTLFFASDIHQALPLGEQSTLRFGALDPWTLPPYQPLPAHHYQQDEEVAEEEEEESEEVKAQDESFEQDSIQPMPPAVPQPSALQVPRVAVTRRSAAVDREPSPTPRGRTPQPQPNYRAPSRERLQKEADERFRAAHPFQPVLYTSPPEERGRRSARELHDLHAQQLRRREQMRQEMESVERLQCPFVPQIGPKSAQLVHNKEQRSRYTEGSGAEGDDIGARLHSYAAAQAAYQHELSTFLVEQSLAAYTFQPDLSSRRKQRSPQQPPIHERLADMQRNKQRHMSELRADQEQQQELLMPFAPRIDTRSKAMAERSSSRAASDDEDIGVRLQREGRKTARRKQELLWEREKQLAEAMEPNKLSAGTARLAARSSFVKADFEQRQVLHAQRVQAHEEEVKEEEQAEQEAWFTPHIQPSSKHILARQRPDLLRESPEQRAERLHEDAQQMADHRRALEAEIYSSLRFQPSLDPMSLALGRRSSIEELHANPRGQAAKDNARRRAEASESEKHTFHPSINAHSQRLLRGADNYDLLNQAYYQQRGYEDKEREVSPMVPRRMHLREPERLAQEIRMHMLQKEERVRGELIMKEIYELQDCTFQPTLATNNYPTYKKQSEEPVVIPGLSRHLELIELRKKQKEEAAQREKEVFHVTQVDKFRRPEDGSTIVEGFQFRLDARSHRSSSPLQDRSSSRTGRGR